MSDTKNQLETQETRALIENFHAAFAQIRTEVRKIIVGQDEVVEHLLLTLLVGGHCLITGMPGTAKTLLVRTLANALGLSFKRIQFTPDLMPTDVTGTDILEEDMSTGRRTWTSSTVRPRPGTRRRRRSMRPTGSASPGNSDTAATRRSVRSTWVCSSTACPSPPLS